MFTIFPKQYKNVNDFAKITSSPVIYNIKRNHDNYMKAVNNAHVTKTNVFFQNAWLHFNLMKKSKITRAMYEYV